MSSDADGKNPRHEEEEERILVAGRPDYDRCDNGVCTSKYTIITFLFVALTEQFKRFANLYFLIVGCIMALGETSLFESAVDWYTTLGPLAVVVSLSLIVEAMADIKRHMNDDETNNAPCVILSRAEDLDAADDGGPPRGEREESVAGGKDVNVDLDMLYYLGRDADESFQSTRNVSSRNNKRTIRVAFQKVRRRDIRQGHFVLVRNREMVPADIVMLASSTEGGNAYIETSSIDGETNLKPRASPTLPKEVLNRLRSTLALAERKKLPSGRGGDEVYTHDEGEKVETGLLVETLEEATKRVTRFSSLAFPDGISVLESPNFVDYSSSIGLSRTLSQTKSRRSTFGGMLKSISTRFNRKGSKFTEYVAALTSEPPNPNVNTFTGKLTLPSFSDRSGFPEVPLSADNLLLRGAILRNTEWVIGLVVFTGADTKLVKNSVESPSKFSQLDQLMNKAVVAILIIMFICIASLSTAAVISNNSSYDELWYIGMNKNDTARWPYLQDLPPPEWKNEQNWLQYFFLFITLLSNLVPLSLYVTVEITNICMLYFINLDLNLYDDTTDTRAVARSNIVTDLGRVQYIFSDKTGTLTQNVMRFKRCSVDGLAFGAPIKKSRPGTGGGSQQERQPLSFHPLRQLLVGQVKAPGGPGLEGLGECGSSDGPAIQSDNMLTFNAEMFLRVMSLCHTVVVEKDLDGSADPGTSDAVESDRSQLTNRIKKFFRGDSNSGSAESPTKGGGTTRGERAEASAESSIPSNAKKGPDGAPFGFAYQAESPDEGALVSAASRNYDFQVVSRDAAGIKLLVGSPSIFEESQVVNSLKGGSLSIQDLALQTAEGRIRRSSGSSLPRFETWTVLAVNKFDSDRKRMSVLIRSPRELGEFTMLLCKGADSSMLDPTVAVGLEEHQNIGTLLIPSSDSQADGSGADISAEVATAQLLALQAHLGDFASEGLRTLVLGVRMLTEKECDDWLKIYNDASKSLKDRDEMLKQAAVEIERNLHIVGATAIEDKLQRNVPGTIATLAKAGIKLWVLTGDKRETAVEIGYSTNVLTPRMNVTEVADKGVDYVQAQVAIEFIRLVKMGKLPQYQRLMVDKEEDDNTKEIFLFRLGKTQRAWMRYMRRSWNQFLKSLRILQASAEQALLDIEKEEFNEKYILRPTEQCRNVRERAEKIIRDFQLKSIKEEKQRKSSKGTITAESSKRLFERSHSMMVLERAERASVALVDFGSDHRNLSIAQITAQQLSERTALSAESERKNSVASIDEDVLSIESFFPGSLVGDFDKKKRTLLERVFAVDREVRKGQLIKHMTKEKLASLKASVAQTHSEEKSDSDGGPCALVIEGAALKHLLGDPELETIIFSVASGCEAVIACRVSPKQKAQLVGLVRQNVIPEPVTLAIGDGANDVGMIQEAHVGIGISGKEGQQAVNASDFSIAQFRFLEDLLLIHGRWDFFRQSVVVLFSFYKNAVMAGVLIFFSPENLYSGTPLFDQWILALLNFVASFPILFLGIFDRCLSREYVKKNPQVYKASSHNQLMTGRVLLRWTCLVLVHIATIYYFTVPALAVQGGISPTYGDFTRNSEGRYTIGDGEGGDLKSTGTVAYTCLIILLAYKVLYESRSIILGKWPALIGCCGEGDSFSSRLSYTFHGVVFGSIGLYMLGLMIYSVLARYQMTFIEFSNTGFHVLGERPTSWILILFVPIWGMLFDISGKVFSNMFYPTQTQIHIEIEALQKLQ